MSQIVSRTLVATLARINADFPESGPHENRSCMSAPGVMSAQYNVDLDAITTKLVRFLAEHVYTTQRDDDASRVSLLSPWTVGDQQINLIAENVSATKPSGAGASKGRTLERLARMRADIDRFEATFRMGGTRGLDSLTMHPFIWPVFGSRQISEAETPEAFFDACGSQIRQTGCVVVEAGLSHAPLPDSLAKSMASGRGLEMLRRRFPAKYA